MSYAQAMKWHKKHVKGIKLQLLAFSDPKQIRKPMKTQCEQCEHLHVDTIATAPEGAVLRMAGQTINDRVHSLHDQLEKLLTGMNETRIYKLTDMFVKE